MSDVDVDAIRAALNKATSGPWELIDGVVGKTPDPIFDLADADRDEPDADLIVLLRNNAEALLAELERAQAASEGVDMLIAQAERRGAVKALREFGYRDVMERADAIEKGADL